MRWFPDVSGAGYENPICEQFLATLFASPPV
jgi:hypothetical protein